MAKHGYFASTKTTGGKPIPITITDKGKIIPRHDNRYFDANGNRRKK